MSSKLSLGLVIGGAVSSTVGAAFNTVEGRIKGLQATASKARILQSTVGETMRLQKEWKKAHDTGAEGADKLRGKLETNLSVLKEQGVEVRNLARAYQTLDRQARGAELKALGRTQVAEGLGSMKRGAGIAMATAGALAMPTKVAGDYQAQIRQMATWAHIAGEDSEKQMAAQISRVATDKGMSQQALAQAVGGLIEKGIDWQESVDYAPLIADLMDGQGMEAQTIATLVSGLQHTGIKGKAAMTAAMGQVAAAGDIGAFGPKEMARYLPSLLGTIRKLGMQGPEAVRFLGASLQSQYAQTQDAAAAATNMDNLLNAVISGTSQERFAKEGYDLASSLIAAQKSGKAANPVEAFILLTDQLIARKDPAQAKQMASLKAQIKAAKDGSAEEAQAFAALLEGAGLSQIVSDKSASAGLLAQIKYGADIKANLQTIAQTDGEKKIAQDAERAREVSKAKWGTVAASMEASMEKIGSAIRPLTDAVADNLTKLFNSLAGIADKAPQIALGGAAAAVGISALFTALGAIKVGRGMFNIARSTLGMGGLRSRAGRGGALPGVLDTITGGLTGAGQAQPVFVTNWPVGGLAGGAGDLLGSRGGAATGGLGKVGRLARMGRGAAAGLKGSAALAVVGGGLIALDTYANAKTQNEKASGYGEAGGTLAGTLAGAAAGAAIGSVVPIIGTALGGIIGGALGAWGGGELGKRIGLGLFGEDEKPLPAPVSLLANRPESERPLGEVARAMAAAQPRQPAPLLVKPVEPDKAARPTVIEKSNTFAPHVAVTVQGDVKDPHELANQLMPYLQRLQADAQARQQSDSLYDAPNL